MSPRRWLPALLIAAVLGLGIRIELSLPLDMEPALQIQKLNPDAQLYYGIAANLLDGTGFEDTTRNSQTLPAFGHPAAIAVAHGWLGWTPARLAWVSVWASALLLVAAVWIYCRRAVYPLAAAVLLSAYLRQTRWLSGNVETSIALSNTLLLFCLAIFYRTGFRLPAAIAAGVALAAALLVRPIYLYAVHAATAAALVALPLLHRRRGADGAPRIVKAWALLLVTAQALLIATLAASYGRYGDSRLVTGTYGAWSLWGGNNSMTRPDHRFVSKELRPWRFYEMRAYFEESEDWQERHDFFMEQVRRYWIEQPDMALHGWAWRLQRFFGFHGDSLPRSTNAALWGPSVHGWLGAVFVSLVAVRLARGGRPRGDRLESALSLGFVCAALFAAYAAVHSLFAYTSFRYVTGALTTLIAATLFLASETLPDRAHPDR